MPDRRFDDDEVREIFRRAAEADAGGAQQGSATARAPGRQEGMSLAELKAIGEDAGIPAHLVAAAAHSLAEPAHRTHGRGRVLPTRVALDVPLSAPLSTEAWDALVPEIRATFRAQGRLEDFGRLRMWRNGNLRVTIEQTSTGAAFRLQSRSGLHERLAGIGALFVTVGGWLSLTGAPMGGGILAIGGLGSLVAARIGAGEWQARRLEQFEALGERVRELTADGE